MNIYLDCIPCFLQQSLSASRKVNADEQTQEQMLREILQYTLQLDFTLPPPVVAQHIHRKLKYYTTIDDPYKREKQQFNKLAMKLLPTIQEQITHSSSPLIEAAKFAIAGNIIDFGAFSNLSEQQVLDTMKQAATTPVHGDWDNFVTQMNQAENILYLADNAGEIAFDKLLIEQLDPKRVTLAVRGSPILNDATQEDAQAVGLHKIVTVIDNGSDAPGTILSDCSSTFQDHFNKADVVISKGQGNYETLSNADANIFYLLKIKCPVIGKHAGLPLGTHALLHTNI